MTVADQTPLSHQEIVTRHISTDLGMAAKMLGYTVATRRPSSAVICGQ